MERTFNTSPLVGYDFAYRCRKVIVCDGCHVLRDDKDEDEENEDDNEDKKDDNKKDSEKGGGGGGG